MKAPFTRLFIITIFIFTVFTGNAQTIGIKAFYANEDEIDSNSVLVENDTCSFILYNVEHNTQFITSCEWSLSILNSDQTYTTIDSKKTANIYSLRLDTLLFPLDSFNNSFKFETVDKNRIINSILISCKYTDEDENEFNTTIPLLISLLPDKSIFSYEIKDSEVGDFFSFNISNLYFEKASTYIITKQHIVGNRVQSYTSYYSADEIKELKSLEFSCLNDSRVIIDASNHYGLGESIEVFIPKGTGASIVNEQCGDGLKFSINPRSNILQVEGDIDNLELINITNLMGKTVLYINRNFENQIDISSLDNGAYLIYHKKKTEKKVSVDKFIKTNIE